MSAFCKPTSSPSCSLAISRQAVKSSALRNAPRCRDASNERDGCSFADGRLDSKSRIRLIVLSCREKGERQCSCKISKKINFSTNHPEGIQKIGHGEAQLPEDLSGGGRENITNCIYLGCIRSRLILLPPFFS